MKKFIQASPKPSLNAAQLNTHVLFRIACLQPAADADYFSQTQCSVFLHVHACDPADMHALLNRVLFNE